MSRAARLVALGLATALSAGLITNIARSRVDFAAEDIGTLQLYVWDEFLIARGVQSMLDHGDFNYRIPVYPAFYPYVSRAVVQLAAPPGEHGTVVTLRWLSWFCMIALLGTVAAFGRTLFPERVAPAVATVFLTAISTELLSWSVLIHPETFVLLILTASLGCALVATRRGPTRASERLLYAATVLASLATATKLVGVFVGPVVAVVVAHHAVLQKREDWRRQTLRTLGFHLAVFVIVFCLASPPAVFDAHAFWNGIQRQLGDNFDSGGTLADWPRYAARGLGMTVLCLGAALTLLTLARAVHLLRNRGATALLEQSPADMRDLALALYSTLFALYVIVGVRIVVARYTLPLFPAFIWLIAGALDRLLASRKKLAVVALALAVLPLAIDVKDVANFAATWPFAEPSDPRLLTRDWMREHLRPGTTIMHDAGIYVPYTCAAEHSWGLRRSRIEAKKPEFVATWTRLRTQFSVDRYPYPQTRSERQAHETFETYKELAENALPNYRQIKAFDDGTVVYQRVSDSM